MGRLRICEHGDPSSQCGVCEPARARARYHANKDEYRDRFLQRLYGITLAEYDSLFDAQDGLCAICGQPETRKARNGVVCRLLVDHDHVTGKVRGLLCHKHNMAIAFFADDPSLLRAAIAYLEEK